MIIFPEIEIMNRIEYLMMLLKTNYESKLTAGKEHESQLYLMFHDGKNRVTNNKGIDYYKQAIELFITSTDKRREIEIRKGWSMNKPIERPVIAVMMTSEQPSGFGIGFDPQPLALQDNYLEGSSRAFSTSYSIWFASQNTDITIVMYKVVRSLMIGSIFMFEDKLQNISFSGNDVSLRPEMAPSGISVRTLSMKFIYQDEGFSFSELRKTCDITFKQHIKLDQC